MRFFCTYFDSGYLSRGLALYRSLREHCPAFRLFVLCLDDACREALGRLRLPGLEPVALAEFEGGDEALAAAKRNRSRVEYYFTCTASFVSHVLERRPEIELLTYLDADLCFFADPEPVFAEIGSGSVAIVGHRYAPALRHKEIYGLYNVGWVSFRRDADGVACLDWWRERCLEWCYDRLEGGRFADQGYLNDWPARFRNVVVLQHPGANLAPWNVANHRLRAAAGGAVLVDDAPLVFFHFHGVKAILPWLYDPGWAGYAIAPSAALRERVYAPYLRTLRELSRELPAAARPVSYPAGRGPALHGLEPVSAARRALRGLRTALGAVRGIATGRYLVVASPRETDA